MKDYSKGKYDMKRSDAIHEANLKKIVKPEHRSDARNKAIQAKKGEKFDFKKDYDKKVAGHMKYLNRKHREAGYSQ